MSLPPYISRAAIHQRLQVIFPEGVAHRTYCIREAAASTIFAMLYVGAIESTDRWVAPKQIVRMTDRQAARKGEAARREYAAASLKPGFHPEGKTWYHENSREQIRDETIRQGFITNNAVVERSGLPTTSGKPRYALRADFARLFDPALDDAAFADAAQAWRNRHLSAAALARTVLVRRGAVTTGEGILVTFPNGETRRMAPGPSSVISRDVIEKFAPRFLAAPALLWLSESGAKVVARDDDLAAQLGLRISTERNLPDIILADIGGDSDHVLLVFVEAVATDGPMTPQRQAALLGIATEAGFPSERVAFVTAYLDRSQAAFRKTVPELAWRSFAWFAAEPEHIVVLRDGASSPALLAKLVGDDC
ncbi:MAG: restriction endonuclease [Betaproteobacteria bacterium]|nr:restriction endonuclease [Betaproteobacteria bacterium]